MLALAEKLGSNDGMLALSLGISEEKLRHWREGFNETYVLCGVETLDNGKLPKEPRRTTLKGLRY